MIQLLFLVLFAEAVLAFLLMVRIGPSRELVMKGLDQIKMGKGPATIKTVAGTMFVILLSNFFSIVKIQNKGFKVGTMTPMDQVLWRTNLLEASLIGFCLFLGFLIDRMHHYFGKLASMKDRVGPTKVDMEKLEKENAQLKEKEAKAKDEMKMLEKEISALKENASKVKMGLEEKDKRIESAETHVAALQKQFGDLLLEYDHLLEENQKLQQAKKQQSGA
ncbi:uncharacterized protein LOC124937567 [Impatiens glandulifera]|uniref:uncharacterized protein LOC124937567 n=1 Tax=Impatiens glandulifera TaxID=253017 RepID=UPI001FB072DE|nr:uncharacterized protein LOC124937567 [Impatiens glandulifera]